MTSFTTVTVSTKKASYPDCVVISELETGSFGITDGRVNPDYRVSTNLVGGSE